MFGRAWWMRGLAAEQVGDAGGAMVVV
ncbi:MAG: hypothetical protein QOD97_674, partial [Mycobacterium sp.]|nr:hypothetical protein [Mycobacterium sp.]